MPLTILAGLPHEGKTEMLLDRVVNAAAGGRPALLLLPRAHDVHQAGPMIAGRAPLGVRIARFEEIIESEWTLRGDGRRMIGSFLREVLLGRALAAAGVAVRPGRGAVALLGMLAEKASSHGARISDRRRGSEGALLTALGRYQADLDLQGLVEPAEAMRLLAACPAPAAAVAVDGFLKLDPVQVDVLAGWAEKGSDVFISLSWRPGSPATSALELVVERLRRRGAILIEAPARRLPCELARIGENLFSGGEPAEGQGHVTLGVAQGDEAEARLIAERVGEAMTEGVAPQAIAVAFPDPSSHAGWLSRVLADQGVPMMLDAPVPVLETPLGRAMHRIWAFIADGRSRDDLAPFLRSPFSGLSAAEADGLDLSWRRQRVSGETSLLRSVGSIRRPIRSCIEVERVPLTGHTACRWKDLADTLLANGHPGANPIPGTDGALDAAVHRSFCRFLSQAVEACEVAVLPTEMWEAFLRSSITASWGHQGVVVTSIRSLASHRFEAVIVGGLTASEIPRVGGEDRLEGDAVKDALAALGIRPDVASAAEEERLAFYLAVSGARRSLHLVRRESDDEGRVLRESVFWDEFLDLYRKPGEHLVSRSGHPSTKVLTSGTFLSSFGAPAVKRGALTSDPALAALSSIDAVTPSEIETYLGCPYKWFIERKAGARALDETVDALAAGRAAHAALARFYEAWKAQGSSRVTAEDLEQATILARRCVAEALDAQAAPRTLDEGYVLSKAVSGVLDLIRRDAGFLPDYHPEHIEWSFGEHGEEAASVGSLRLRGRADRIDVGPEGLIIIDYKASRAASLAQIEKQGLVQLQLYAAVASRRLGLPIAGGLYRGLSSRSDRGFVLDGVNGRFVSTDIVDRQRIDDVIAEAVQAAECAVEGMRAGRIEPVVDQDGCGTCGARSFCAGVTS